MKIVHVIDSIDPVVGGPPQVALRLAAAQAKLGHCVHLITYGSADPEAEKRAQKHFAAVPNAGGLHLYTLAPPSRFERLFAARCRTSLREWLRDSDWVHLHGVWERLLHRAAQEASRLDVPYCFRPSGMLNPWSLRQKLWKKKLALALAVRRTLNGAAFIHCLNSDEAALIKPLGLAPESLVFPNGVFLEELEPLPPPGTFISRYPALRGRRFVLFLGRLNRVKGLDYLAGAWAKCARGLPDFDLVVAGPEGGVGKDFQQRIADAGLNHRVHLVGPLYGAEKISALVDAYCFCLPSRQEGFSVAIVEALACGVPVIMSEACRFPEAAAAGAADIIALDEAQFAHAITQLARDPKRAREMSHAGRELIRRDYTWPAIASRLLIAYESARAAPATSPASQPCEQ